MYQFLKENYSVDCALYAPYGVIVMPMLPADQKDALQEYKAAKSLIDTQKYKIYFIQVAPLITLIFA